MKILLTVSVNYIEIDKKELLGFKIFNFADVYLKYDISISNKEKYNSRQKYLSKEISLLNEDLIIVNNPCYDLKDVSTLINELKIEHKKQLIFSVSGAIEKAFQMKKLKKISKYSKQLYKKSKMGSVIQI